MENKDNNNTPLFEIGTQEQAFWEKLKSRAQETIDSINNSHIPSLEQEKKINYAIIEMCDAKISIEKIKATEKHG